MQIYRNILKFGEIVVSLLFSMPHFHLFHLLLTMPHRIRCANTIFLPQNRNPWKASTKTQYFDNAHKTIERRRSLKWLTKCFESMHCTINFGCVARVRCSRAALDNLRRCRVQCAANVKVFAFNLFIFRLGDWQVHGMCLSSLSPYYVSYNTLSTVELINIL